MGLKNKVVSLFQILVSMNQKNRRLTNIYEQLIIIPKDVIGIICEYDYYIEGTLTSIEVNKIYSINHLCILSDKEIFILTGSKNYIWKLYSGKIDIYDAFNLGVYCVTSFSDGKIVVGTYDNYVCIWNLKTKICETVFNSTDNKLILCVATLPDKRIVSGHSNRLLKIWNPNSGNCDMTFKGHLDWIQCVTILLDGRIASGSFDYMIKIWDVKTGQRSNPEGKCDVTLEGHTGIVFCISAFLMNGQQHLVSGSADKTLRIWNVETSKCISVLRDHVVPVRCVAILPDGRIVSGCDDGTIKIWNPFGSAEQPVGPLRLPIIKKCDYTFQNNFIGNHVDNIVVLRKGLPDGPGGIVCSGSSDRKINVWC
jgi:WD40 repeat protein